MHIDAYRPTPTYDCYLEDGWLDFQVSTHAQI